jgi:hypothetical protein
MVPTIQLLALRLAVGLWILIPAAGVRIPESQPINSITYTNPTKLLHHAVVDLS